MNASHENQNPSQPDDLADRLLDVALAELVGGSVPPDLSSRIAADRVRQPAVPRQAPSTRPNRAFWVSLAAAAMLLVSVTIALLQPLQHVRDSAPVLAAKVTTSRSRDRQSQAPLCHGRRAAMRIAF